MNYINISIRKNIFTILFFVIVVSCKTKNSYIKYYASNKDYIYNTLNIHNIFDDYYLTYDHYPKSINELIKKFKISKDSLTYIFNDPFQKGKLIKYIPIYKDNTKYPSAYFITSNNARINSINEKRIDAIKDAFTVIYKDTIVTEKPVIYDYSNKYLVKSGVQMKYYQIKNNEKWKDKYYDLVFEVENGNFTIKQNEIIARKNNNIVIKGKLFSNFVANKLINKKFKSVKLIGFKYKVHKDTIFLKNVMFYKERKKSGYYYNEVGEAIKLPINKFFN